MTKEIEGLEDVKLMVDTFYGKVREDELIGPIFNGVIQDRWPVHLDKMYRFWQTVLFEEHTYNGRPFPKHAHLPVEKKHFDRWLSLFTGTVDSLFTGKRAEEAKWRANNMAIMFNSKIQYIKQHSAG